MTCLLLVAGAGGPEVFLVPSAHVTAASLAAPVFPGPARGVPATQAPLPTDFVLHGVVGITDAVQHASGVTVFAGAALRFQAEGQAVLYLDVVSGGTFTAFFAIPDTETTAEPGMMRVRVIGADGFILRGAQALATRGARARPISISVANGVAVVLDYLDYPPTHPTYGLIYNARLTGSARARRAASAPGNTLPSGALPLNLAEANHNGITAIPTEPVSVTLVGLPQGNVVTASYAGTFTIGLPPGTSGTLVLRYGATDTSMGGLRSRLSVTVLDADGHLLRKAIGEAFAGGGLRPLWVDLRGGSTVTFLAGDEAAVTVAITAVGIVPGHLTPTYRNPSRVLYGGIPGGVALDSSAFVAHCGSGADATDIIVAHTIIMGHTSLTSRGSCGSIRLVLSVAGPATFHTLFAVPDNASGSAQPSLMVVATASDNTPLFQRTYRAPFSTPGIPIDVNLHKTVGRTIKNVSVLSFIFTNDTDSVLYDARLTGNATAYSEVAAPVEPPVLGNGVAINPRAFIETDMCALTNKDMLLLHEVALPEWALNLTPNCDSASLGLPSLPYPHHRFAARLGIDASENPDTIVKIHYDVLNGAGKSLRHSTLSVRYGYGPINAGIDLTGGVQLRISYEGGTFAKVIVYAMTAS